MLKEQIKIEISIDEYLTLSSAIIDSIDKHLNRFIESPDDETDRYEKQKLNDLHRIYEKLSLSAHTTAPYR